MPAKAPSAPSVIARRSLSLPTQHMTKSWPSAAAFGVGAVFPPNFSAHALALAGVLLNTVTSWPPFFTRCPAMGKPITPRPRKATLAMCPTLGFCRHWRSRTVFWRGAAGWFGARNRFRWRCGTDNKPCAMKGNCLRLADEAGFARLNLREIRDFKKKGVTSHERERRRARSFQYPDPQAGRHGPVLRGCPGPGEGRPAELCLPRGMDVQRGQAGGASGRYFPDRRAAKAGFRRRPSRRLRQPGFCRHEAAGGVQRDGIRLATGSGRRSLADLRR